MQINNNLFELFLYEKAFLLGRLKIWSNVNLDFLAGEMSPFPAQIMALQSGDDQIEFTHGRHPPINPIENIQARF